MQVSTESIRLLRERTGAGIMDSKRALEDAGGDMEKAEQALREKGMARAATKADRATAEGVIDSYIHAGSRIGAMIELNCETDFVGRTPEFRELAHNIAMQVAAMSPLYLDEGKCRRAPRRSRRRSACCGSRSSGSRARRSRTWCWRCARKSARTFEWDGSLRFGLGE